MYRITLDKNVLVDLQESRESAPFVKKLIEFHNAGTIKLQVSKAQASEGTRESRGQEGASLFSEFESWLWDIGMPRDIEQLFIPAVWGFSYWGQSTYVGEKEQRELEALKNVLFPDLLSNDRRFRNKLCDVLALFSHFKSDGDIFVTNDGNFSQKLAELQKIQICKIMTPRDTVNYLETQSAS